MRWSEGLGSGGLFLGYLSAVDEVRFRGGIQLPTERSVVLISGGGHESEEDSELSQLALDVSYGLGLDHAVAVFTLGVEGGQDRDSLERLATQPEYAWAVEDSADLSLPMGQIADQIATIARSNVAMGICTPEVSGEPSLSVVVDDDGVQATESITYAADGLSGDQELCDPRATVDPCFGRTCGLAGLFELDCGSCSGPTAVCTSQGQCIDDCGGRECGRSPVEGYLCGVCFGETDTCTPEGMCWDDCGGRQCGVSPVEGYLCGTCPSDTESCSELGLCFDDCAQRECGLSPTQGFWCGTCEGATELCDADGFCINDCGGRECGSSPVGGYLCGVCGGITDTCSAEGHCVDDCEGRACGASPVEGYLCGVCEGATDICSSDGVCIDDCADRECGLSEQGLSCGSCSSPTELCTGEGQCVDDCVDRACGFSPTHGFFCGTCPGPFDTCTTDGQCVTIVYVDVDSIASNPDGLSWHTAFPSVREGIEAAREMLATDDLEAVEVWVAEGTYFVFETRGLDTVQLFPGVQLYGGFSGVENAREQRDWTAHTTILDGRQSEESSDRVFSVVTGSDDAVIDGFRITEGYGWLVEEGFDIDTWVDSGGGMRNDGTSPIVRNCVFTRNSARYGGAMVNYGGSPTVSNCTFVENDANNGGAIYDDGGSMELVNSRFVRNEALLGAAIYTWRNSQIEVTSSTFFQNIASVVGGAVVVHDGSLTLTNCTVSDNVAPSGGGIYGNESSVLITNSIVWGNTGGEISQYLGEVQISFSNIGGDYPGVGNIDADPLFVSAVAGNLQLRGGSPCIDAANGDMAPSLDFRGRTRVDDPDILNTGIGNPIYADMGAFEYDPLPDACADCTGSTEICLNDGACIDDCHGRTCGLSLIENYVCGSCSGATETCDPEGQCIDDCVDRECGLSPIAGYECGSCSGATETCNDTGECVDDCVGRECGLSPTLGLDCGSCPDATSFCISDGLCVDACADLQCGPSAIEGYDCGTCEAGQTCRAGLCAQPVVFVDVDSTASNPDGMTWESAYPRLQDGIDTAHTLANEFEEFDVIEIWVTAGTYFIFESDPYDTVQLRPSVSVYGGFSGTEHFRAERGTHWTFLDGHQSEESTNQVYHVVTGSDDAVIDRLSITGGNSDVDVLPSSERVGGGMLNIGVSLTVSNCDISVNSASSGGGMYNRDSAVTIDRSIFAANTGGGMFNVDSVIDVSSSLIVVNTDGGINSSGGSVSVINSFFSENHSSGNGGGMRNHSSLVTISNSTFRDNTAEDRGGAVFQYSGVLVATDSHFVGNIARDGGGISTWHSSSFHEIHNCGFVQNMASEYGGGLYNLRNSPFISNSSFEQNVAQYGGGMANEPAMPSIVESTFVQNSARDGGAIYNSDWSDIVLEDSTLDANTASNNGGGIFNQRASAQITRCTFENNRADRYGGGLCNRESSSTVQSSVFEANTAGLLGGGISSGQSVVEATDCLFIENTAGGRGGGVYDSNDEGISSHFANCEFWGNRTDGSGGGMGSFLSSPLIDNCIFVDNHAVESGGGMYARLTSRPVLNGCALVNNSSRVGGGVFSHSDSAPLITNSIVWGNEGGQIDDQESGVITVRYSDVEGGYEGTGNIDQDPLFVDPSAADLHLQSGSPCIDAADANAATDTDFSSNPRMDDGDTANTGFGEITFVDIGPHEFQPDEVFCEDCTGATETCTSGRCVDDRDGLICGQSPIRGFACGSCDTELACLNGACFPRRIFVDVDSPATAPDGLSWETAFGTVQEGLDAAYDWKTQVVWIGSYRQLCVCWQCNRELWRSNRFPVSTTHHYQLQFFRQLGE